MSIRHGLLALLAQGPRYGYQLRAEFEATTGSTWPLNIGQVYTTLGRLERDGLALRGEEDSDGRFSYEITPDGLAEVRRWFTTPLARTDRPRDELAIKLALALTSPEADVRTVVQSQRTATMRSMQELTRLKSADGEPAWLLVLESMIFQAEAEIRWLDHCEAAVLRGSPAGPKAGPAATPGQSPDRSPRQSPDHSPEPSHERA